MSNSDCRKKNKMLTRYLIRDGKKYLYWNKAFLARGLHWKDGREGASIFDRHNAEICLKELKRQGYFNVAKERIKK